jgi:hypothetical protein
MWQLIMELAAQAMRLPVGITAAFVCKSMRVELVRSH